MMKLWSWERSGKRRANSCGKQAVEASAGPWPHAMSWASMVEKFEFVTAT
jgi:hypothetical protein